jgi:hypothetical protein
MAPFNFDLDGTLIDVSKDRDSNRHSLRRVPGLISAAAPHSLQDKSTASQAESNTPTFWTPAAKLYAHHRWSAEAQKTGILEMPVYQRRRLLRAKPLVSAPLLRDPVSAG